MKKLLKKMSLMVVTVMIFSFAFSANFGLYSSLTTAGTTMGGLRIDTGIIAKQATCVNLSYSNDGTNYTYWADAYWGYFGIALSGGDAVSETTSLMFALEQPITEKVSLGISCPVISKAGSADLVYVGGFDVYAIMMF